jgi:TATA-box binding protein (TBP) (component of TFIID and TFIIIB)
MKNKIILMALLLVFSGCVAEKTYATGKVICTGAKTVYIEIPAQSRTLEKTIVGIKYRW